MATEAGARAAQHTPWPWRSAATIGAFTILLLAWLIFKPANHRVFVAVDNVAQFTGPLLVVLLCALSGLRGGARSERGARRWVPYLLGLAALCYALGQIIYTVYEQLLGYTSAPFPSWSDAVYLSAYPFLLLGILLLPGRRVQVVSQARVLIDGLMIMTAAITFSWYFILGPTVLQGSASAFATIVAAAYPVSDLVLIVCLLLLSGRLGDPRVRRVGGVLVCALLVIVVTDSIYDLQQLHGAYATGAILDVGWPLGYMLVGLAALMSRSTAGGPATVEQGDPEQFMETAPQGSASGAAPAPALWRSLLPYALVPLTGVLLIYVWQTGGDSHLATGAYIGAGLLVLLVLLRQIVAMRELHALYANNDALTQANQQLEVMATTDSLTGLPNRALLRDRLQQAILSGQRNHSSVSLLLMDLDRFKEVNDTLGHYYGDLLLQQVGARLDEALRASDTVARLGGDEFAVLLPATDRRGALEVARKLLDVIDAPFVVDGQDLTVGTSIGVALCPDHGSDAETLLRYADVAMYLAKRSHSGYAVYDVEQDEHSKRRLALTSELREALATGDLLVYYQPLVDLERDAVVGVEALVRWPHSQHGFIPPDYFIPLAEHTGLIAPLTTFVLETALQQCQSLQRAGRSIGVAVNISTRVLHDTDFPGTVAALLARYGVPPALLTLEITESALMMDPERALGVLQSLSALGLHTAIDDFGTGYSSLGYLKQLPVDEVKIDKSFVFGMDENPKDEAIVRSVVAMAHAMGLSVVAEGVENGEAWELLRGLGCDVVQGYYVSRPLPATELARWLDTSSWGSATDKASA